MAFYSKGASFTQRKVEKGFRFFSLPKVGAHKRVPSKQLYYWVTEPLMRYPWKIVWMLFFNKGLIRHRSIWETLHFKALTQIWLSKVKGPALPKERWRKGFAFFFSLPKVGAHKRAPSKQLYWVTEPLMRYPWKIVWMLFFNKGLIRHRIIWETLHFKALTQLWLSTVKGPALPKERCRKGFVFSLPKVGAHNRVPSRQLYYWVTEPLMRYPLEKLSGYCFLIRV